MDRFVTRAPTWKTLSYSSMAAQALSQKKCISKTVDKKKGPLQQKQLNEIANHYDFETRLADMLPSTHFSNAENFNANSNDSGLSSASSISPQHMDDNEAGNQKILTPTINYLDCPVEKENDIYMTITHTPKSHKKVAESGSQVERTFEVNKNFNPEFNHTPEKPLLKTTNMIMARIQRDLNSPSATARMKAIRAMKSPTKSAYCQFDIPETEQSLHIPEPPSLQEIMRNIVVYVEVRSGEDNRSAGVRKVIEALGARVSLSLNRETTHVIFKDGLLSTYKKATQMNIPIVSILWIEACKNQRRICDPNHYPISNLDRYENPELYTKMKRVKSMQPDSECNKRIRAKAGGTPKDCTSTQKSGNLKKTSTFIGGTPTSATSKKKTDISQFFKKIEKLTPSASNVDCGINGSTLITESPATQLLNRIHSESYTPLNESTLKTFTQENSKNTQNFSANGSKLLVGAKKTLDFLQDDKAEGHIKASIRSNVVVGIKTTIEGSPLPKARGRPRRHSLMQECEIETATYSMNTMAISVSTPSKSNNRRRRSSIHTSKDMSLAAKTPCKINNIQTITEECNEVGNEQDTPTKPFNRRRTLYAAKTMDETDLMESKANKGEQTPSKRSASRRTLYTSKAMETSEINEVVNKVVANVSNRRRTCFNFKSLEQTEIPQMTDSEALNVPNKDKAVNSQSIDLGNDIQMSTPRATEVVKPSNRRRTLYGAKTINETDIATLTPDVTACSSICSTPTNFKTGRVVSSTLLDDNANRSELLVTPPANITSGKLLEETEQCATPLIFSSTRQPGVRRRTKFDVSMDIITQRLQCINQSARRSLAPPMPSAEIANILEKPISTPINIKSNNLLNCATPKSSIESLNECNDNNDNINNNTDETITMKKRRKLFMPNEMLVTTPAGPASSTANTTESDKLIAHPSSNTSGNSAIKRRRTLMPISQPQPTTTVTHKDSICNTVITPTVRKRRSTLDFEQMRTTNTKVINDAAAATPSGAKNSTQQQFKAKKTPVLVYTNMHQQQIDVIREAIDKLHLFVLESNVTNNTTHLVSLEPRRTLNLLRALARGLWILDYSWITDSVKAGKWLSEELYELQHFSRAIEICRSERQAFGNNFKCDLFRKFGAFYISSHCSPISKENMRELIALCGGHVVNARQKARYIIGDANRTLEDKLYLTPYWVLDSISQMQLIKINKYMYPLPDERAASQALEF